MDTQQVQEMVQITKTKADKRVLKSTEALIY